MNRRRFLSFLGLAPVAAAVPAMALPRAEKLTKIELSPEVTNPLIFKDGRLWINQANIGSITAGTIRTRNGIEMDMQTGNVRFTV